jgi:hypothetical protein
MLHWIMFMDFHYPLTSLNGDACKFVDLKPLKHNDNYM